MAKLKELEQTVLKVLTNIEESRKDDFRLLYEVCKELNPTVETMSFKSMMLCHKQFKMPSFESITRCRRKLQERKPELRDAQAVEIRVEQQGEFIEYAFNF